MSTGGGDAQRIPINQLSIQDLSVLQGQIEREVQFFASSLKELREGQQRFANTRETVRTLSKEPATNAPATALVPLTESLNCHDVVLVEIGTGYFVEMKHDKAIAYYQRKYDFLAKQIDQVAQVLGEKQNAKTAITETFRMKIQSAISSQQSSSTGDGVASSA